MVETQVGSRETGQLALNGVKGGFRRSPGGENFWDESKSLRWGGSTAEEQEDSRTFISRRSQEKGREVRQHHVRKGMTGRVTGVDSALVHGDGWGWRGGNPDGRGWDRPWPGAGSLLRIQSLQTHLFCCLRITGLIHEKWTELFTALSPRVQIISVFCQAHGCC